MLTDSFWKYYNDARIKCIKIMQNVSIPSETITPLSSLTSIKIALIGKFEHLDSQSQKNNTFYIIYNTEIIQLNKNPDIHTDLIVNS